MSDYDLIIFDCDGTLTDSEYVNNRALLEVLHADGFTQFDLDYAYKHWVGTTVSSILLNVQMETGHVPAGDIVQRYIRRVGELQQTEMKAVDGAEDLVSRAARKYKICVASNGERSNVINSLKLCGLLKYFRQEHVFTKIQVKNPKPYPDLFLFAADHMGAEPSRCVVIEDSMAGTRAGIAAGMTTYGFTGSSHDPDKQAENLANAGATEVFPRLIHIADKLSV